jgi:maleylpyruvate isomerase
MRLHGFWRSTATWRVRIALEHKGIAYDYVPVHLVRGGGEQHREEFRAMNPMRHVPVLELTEGGTTHHLAESMAILEFLEERAPSPPLLPADPFLRARARQLALLVVSGIQPLQNTKVQQWVKNELHADEVAWAHHWVTLGLDALEVLTRETAGRFSVGDAPSFADVCLVPQLHFARRFAVDVARYPTLEAIEGACSSLPSFVAAHADRQIDAEPAA